jgi:hypothetical protein
MGNFLSSRDFLDDLQKGITNCCGNVRPNQKGMHGDFGNKLRLKWGDIILG